MFAYVTDTYNERSNKNVKTVGLICEEMDNCCSKGGLLQNTTYNGDIDMLITFLPCVLFDHIKAQSHSEGSYPI